ncbi:hypothetical protein [Acaricomes phytoseiuli]|uniref:hypothetical protein n=1 Tax=Acaricomes phytoseiuli TaxID=291968 RepID=UPI0012E9ACED|nr:hypothetical protein [Acaricomes phytoseiuli]
MADVKISAEVFESAGKALNTAAGTVEALAQDASADLGHPGLRTAADDAATTWAVARSALGSAMASESRQVASVAVVFAQVDEALSRSITGIGITEGPRDG